MRTHRHPRLYGQPHTAALTPVQILKARYDEARAIKQAWDVRLDSAQRRHSEAVRNHGDFEATRRTLDAVEIQVNDAAAELKVAIDAWLSAAHHAERRVA